LARPIAGYLDSETGLVEREAYNAVDDCGNVLQPVPVEGQVRGGIAQGVGQVAPRSRGLRRW
jgi:CO/xanthine dehydrogenase Mo-binding subunit